MHRVINICASVTALRRSSRARRRNNCILKDAIIARRISCILEKCRSIYLSILLQSAVSPASSPLLASVAPRKRQPDAAICRRRQRCEHSVEMCQWQAVGLFLQAAGSVFQARVLAACARVCLCTPCRTQRRRLPGCCMSVHVYVSLCTPRPTQRLRLGSGAGHYGVPGLPPPCGLYQGARRQVGHEQLHVGHEQLHLGHPALDLGHPALELCCFLVRLTALVLHSQLRTLHQG